MSNRKRILYVQPNSEIGGSDLCLVRLFRAIDQTKFEPIVLVPKDGPIVPLYKQAGAKVIFTPMLQLRTLPSPIYQAKYLASFWLTVFRIRNIIRENQIDLVHTNSLYCLYGAWAAKLAGAKHVWHIREIPPNIPIAKTIYAKMVLLLSRLVIPMTQPCGTGLFGKKSNHPKLRYLHDAIDLNEFGVHVSGERIRRELDIPWDVPLVGFVARLDPWKGLDVFIKAAAIVARQFPSAQFIVAGGPPSGFETHENEMKKLAAQLGLADRIHFLGFKYRLTDIPEVMSALNVFSHTSIQPEPFGLVIIEAMACGTPVVAAAAGGPLEIIVDGESGFLTQPGSPEAHAAAVCRLLGDSALSESIGNASRLRTEQHFSLPIFGPRIEAIYNEVLGDRS